MRIAALTLLFNAALSQIVAADLVTYTDRTSWEAAIASRTVLSDVDFSSFSEDVFYTTTNPLDVGPFLVSVDNDLFPAFQRVDVPPPRPGTLGVPFTDEHLKLVVDSSPIQTTTLTYDVAFNAWGADFGGALGSSTTGIQFTTNLGTTYTIDFPTDDGFLGFTADGELISEITVLVTAGNPSPEGLGLDNIVTAVPEPSNFLFCGLAAILTGPDFSGGAAASLVGPASALAVQVSGIA